MQGRWLVGMCLLAWLCLAGSAGAQSVPYTYAYPYGWGGWKPSDEWVRRDAFGRPHYLGWRVHDNLYGPPPRFTYRWAWSDRPPPLAAPGLHPPAEAPIPLSRTYEAAPH